MTFGKRRKLGSMPNKYTLSKRADNNIESIFEHSYRSFGLDQALKYKAGLEHCLQLIAENPDLGRKCDDISEGYQRHEYERHIVFYRKRANDIFVTAIIHESRDVKRLLDK